MHFRRNNYSTALLILVSITLSGQVLAQPAVADSTFMAKAQAHAVKLYQKSVRDQALLYNGSEYNPFTELKEEHPFFEVDEWEEGSIDYEGELYDMIPLMYDMVRDELIIEHYDQNGYVVSVRLLQERVKAFSLRGHVFIRLTADTTNVGIPHTGYYDLLYDGSVKVVARRKKNIREEITYSELRKHFDYKVSYYLYKNGVYYPVKSKHSVIKVLKDRKEKVNRLAARNRLNSSTGRESVIVQLATYYDQPE